MTETFFKFSLSFYLQSNQSFQGLVNKKKREPSQHAGEALFIFVIL